MKIKLLAFLIIILLVIIPSVPASFENSGVVNTTPSGLVRFMEQAAVYADTHGIEASLLAFQDLFGPFIQDDLYIYAYDMNGTLLAHPFLPNDIGKNRLKWTDVNGMEVIRLARDIARQGEGFFVYLYPAPEGDLPIAENATLKSLPKLGYSRALNDSVWIGSGLYLKNMTDSATGKPLLDRLEEFVTIARDYAVTTNKEDAIQEFNNPNGSFTHESEYIFAIDMNGTVLAQPYDQSIIGKNHMDIVRNYGVKSVMQAVRIAKEEGSGFLAYTIDNPSTKGFETKLSYISRVDNEWFVGSGWYISDIIGSSLSAEQLVDSAVSLIEEKGSGAFDELRDPAGPYNTESLYIFADSRNGTMLVNAAFPELEGTSVWDLQDEEGQFFVREYINKTLASGSGWTSYLWPKAGETIPSVKYAYTRMAKHENEEYIVGAGIYL